MMYSLLQTFFLLIAIICYYFPYICAVICLLFTIFICPIAFSIISYYVLLCPITFFYFFLLF
jgi:hypothetical protein